MCLYIKNQSSTQVKVFSMSFSSKQSTKPLNYSESTKSGLNKIFNEPVISAEKVQRPASINSGSSIIHKGVKVTTSSGNEYLVHKGSDYGKSSQTVVTPASDMSKNWKSVESHPVSNAKVGDFVKAGGANYNVVNDNCYHATDRMMNVGKTKK